MMTEIEYRTCADVLGWDTSNCCDSCHSDYDEWDYEMCSYEQGNVYYHICCRCWEWLQSHPLDAKLED